MDMLNVERWEPAVSIFQKMTNTKQRQEAMLAADDHTFAILENKLNVRTRGNYDCLLKVYEYLQEELHKEKSQSIDPNLLRSKRHAQEAKKRQLVTGIQLEKERLLFTMEDMQTRSSNLVNDTLAAQARINTYLHTCEMSLVHQKTKWMLRVPTFTTRIMDDITNQGDETSLEYRAKERENTAIYYCQYYHREILCGSPIIFDQEKLRAELLETESTTLRYHAMELLCLYTQTLSSNWESSKFNLAQRLDPLFLYYLPFTMFATLSHLTQTENMTNTENNQQFDDKMLVLLPILLRACEYYLELSQRLFSIAKTRVLVVDSETLLLKLKELHRDPQKLSHNSNNGSIGDNNNSRPISSRIRGGKKNEGKESIHDIFRSILLFHFHHSRHGMLAVTANLTRFCNIMSANNASSAVIELKSVALCRTTITSSLLRVVLFVLSLYQKLGFATTASTATTASASTIVASTAATATATAQLTQSAIKVAAIASNRCNVIMGIPGHFGVLVIPEPFQLALLIDFDICAAMDIVTHYLSSSSSNFTETTTSDTTTSSKLTAIDVKEKDNKPKTPVFSSSSSTRKMEKMESKAVLNKAGPTPIAESTKGEESVVINQEKLNFINMHTQNLEWIAEVLSTARNATFHRGMSPFVITSFLHLIFATSTFLITQANIEGRTKNQEKANDKSEEIMEEKVEKCRGILSSMIERLMAVSIWHKQSVSITRLVMLCLR